MNYEQKAISLSNEQKRILTAGGYNVSGPVKGSYCYELTALRGKEKVKVLTYFSLKGNKILLQGNKESEIYNDIHRLIFGESLFTADDETIEPDVYIGTDESGKGDYFGPLVTAGVYVDKNVSEQLKKVGVKDSKVLTEFAIRKLESDIKSISGGKFNIVVINPEKYNALYDKFGNLNKLLGWAHARVLENLLSIQEADTAISDKFGDERYIIISLQSKGKQLRLLQYHRAEKYTAVAAASILARGRMLNWFEAAGKKYGMEIPKGASPAVEAAAKKIKEKYGDDVLYQLTKKHFKTTNRI